MFIQLVREGRLPRGPSSSRCMVRLYCRVQSKSTASLWPEGAGYARSAINLQVWHSSVRTSASIMRSRVYPGTVDVVPMGRVRIFTAALPRQGRSTRLNTSDRCPGPDDRRPLAQLDCITRFVGIVCHSEFELEMPPSGNWRCAGR